jgi:hypothetical protein
MERIAVGLDPFDPCQLRDGGVHCRFRSVPSFKYLIGREPMSQLQRAV